MQLASRSSSLVEATRFIPGLGVHFTNPLMCFQCTHTHTHTHTDMGFPGGSESKESACNAGGPDLIPESGRSSGEGNGYPLQYSCLENSTDREEPGRLQRARHNRPSLSFSHTHTHTHTHLYICVYVCIPIYMHICLCICMY